MRVINYMVQILPLLFLKQLLLFETCYHDNYVGIRRWRVTFRVCDKMEGSEADPGGGGLRGL